MPSPCLHSGCIDGSVYQYVGRSARTWESHLESGVWYVSKASIAVLFNITENLLVSENDTWLYRYAKQDGLSQET